jgi:hypothetical protein
MNNEIHPFRDAIAVFLPATRLPLAPKLENILYSSELDDSTLNKLQDFCSMNACPSWATGESMISAADLLVERAIENANLQVKEVDGERIIRFNQG